MKDVFLAAAILLGACSSTVPGTVLKLASVDPLTADPADIALQASLPDGVGLLPRAGTLALRAELRDGSEKSGAFPVERVGDVLRVAPASHDAPGMQRRWRRWPPPSATPVIKRLPCRQMRGRKTT